MGLVRVLDFRLEKKGRRYRGSLEIAKDMLSVAFVKVRKTRIMYQANLSYRLMEKYLSNLLENDLLECDNDCFYLITRKGKEFLQMYDDYLERHVRIREEIKGADEDRLLLENMCFNSNCNSKRIASKKEVLV